MRRRIVTYEDMVLDDAERLAEHYRWSLAFTENRYRRHSRRKEAWDATLTQWQGELIRAVAAKEQAAVVKDAKDAKRGK